MTLLAKGTLLFGVVSFLALLTLHFVSAEIKPSFRMISEYAYGNHKWLITLFFICWGLCTIASGLLLWNVVTTGWAKFAVILLFITGIGAIMGGLFDVQHKLHGLAFGIGIPFMPIGALIIAYHLLKKAEWQNNSSALLYASHATWLSVVLMAVSMMVLFSGLKSAGIAFGPNQPPLTELPKGVIGLNGWAGRLVVLCYLLFPILIAKIYLTIHSSQN